MTNQELEEILKRHDLVALDPKKHFGFACEVYSLKDEFRKAAVEDDLGSNCFNVTWNQAWYFEELKQEEPRISAVILQNAPRNVPRQRHRELIMSRTAVFLNLGRSYGLIDSIQTPVRRAEVSPNYL